MAGQGYNEAINLSFAGETDHLEFPPLQRECAAVRNPLTEDTQFMRTTLAAGLVKSAKRNFNYGQRLVRLFELGKVYCVGRDGAPIEKNVLGILGTGGFTNQNWKNPSASYDFFHLKGALSLLLQGLRIPSFEFEPAEIAWLNSSEAALLKIGGEIAGVFGLLAASLEEKNKLKQPVYLAEIEFECIARHAFSSPSYDPLPRYPSAERDMSIVVSRDLAFQTIHSGISRLGISELAQIQLIDVFEGEKIPEGKVSLTLRLTFLDREKTLTVDRVQDFIDTILLFIQKTYGAGLRSI
jgi:phenylalanyl-tRNA synthetase beta chain